MSRRHCGLETDLIDIAMALRADAKGLLAMDESNSTCNKRFAKLGIP
jgi:fructose-bisphosphate aldolase class I